MQVIMVVVIANNYATEEVEEIVQTKIVQVLAFIGELLVMFYLLQLPFNVHINRINFHITSS